MKKTLAITAVMVSLLLVLVFAGGCLGQKIAERVTEEVIEKAIESEGGGDVEIDLDDGKITIQGDDGEVNISADDETIEIQSDDGEVTIGTGADLPDGFPGDVPIYPDMEITMGWAVTEDSKDSYSVNGLTEDAGDDVFAWYKDKLSGWDIENEFTASGDDVTTSSLSAKNGGLEVFLMVIESEDEGTVITLSVTEE